MRTWQLATVALVAARGDGRALALGQDRRAAGGDDRGRRRRASSRSPPLRGRWRGRRGRRLSPPRRWSCSALLAAGCGSGSGARDGQVEVVATTTQIGDLAREVGGNAVAVDQMLQPNTDPHDYEPRPSDVPATAEAKLVFASGDELDELDRPGRLDSGSDAAGRRPGRGRAGAAAGRVERRRGIAVRPALVARPAQRRGRRARDRATRWRSPTPRTRRDFDRNAGAYLAKLRALDGEIARCMDAVPAARRKLVTDHDAFGYFAQRYGIDVVGAVIPSQTTQAQPSAEGPRAPRRPDRTRGRRGDLPRELAEPEARRGDRRPDRRLGRLHALRRHARARRTPTAPPTCGWRRPTRTRWCAASPAGGADASLSP